MHHVPLLPSLTNFCGAVRQAGLAFGLSEPGTKKNVLVFDLGGGTLDVTLVRIEDTDYKVFATSGDTHLGGEDFDQRVMNHLIQKFNKR